MIEPIRIPDGIRSLPLDETLQSGVDERRRQAANYEIPLAEARKRFIDARLPPAGGYGDGIVTEARTIPGPGGPIPVRIYRDGTRDGALPVLIYFHGGGFVLGGLDTHDWVCRAFCRDQDLMVLSVDYRLAPEHPYPAAVDDGVAALRFVAEHGASIGADPARIVLAGDSAGGMLTLAAALRARDEGGPAILALVGFYPMADLTQIGERTSYQSFGDGSVGLSTHDVDWFVDCYCPSERRGEAYASPVLAPDLAGLPPTLIVLAEQDVLFDEGLQISERLDAAGVPVTRIDVAGANHGFLSSGLDLPSIADTYARIRQWLASRLSGQSASL